MRPDSGGLDGLVRDVAGVERDGVAGRSSDGKGTMDSTGVDLRRNKAKRAEMIVSGVEIVDHEVEVGGSRRGIRRWKQDEVGASA